MLHIRFWSLLCVLALMTSCNFTEELHLKDDGSGKISIHFDGSEMMEMMGDEMMQGEEKAMDSLISFRQFLNEKKDSIATLSEEEQARLKKLEPFNLHIVMDPETKVMKFDMFTDFANLNEVGDTFNAFQDASALGPGGGSQSAPGGLGNQNTEVDYLFKANTFKRSSRIVDSLLHKQNLDSLAGAEMFLGSSMYKLKYHFPRRIKSASTKTATYSADGKTLFYEVSFLSYLKKSRYPEYCGRIGRPIGHFPRCAKPL